MTPERKPTPASALGGSSAPPGSEYGSAAASASDFARDCCGDPDCPNDCEREQPESEPLSDYEKGYLDGLLEGTRTTPHAKWVAAYMKAATAYLESTGRKGWKVNAI